MVLKLLPYYLNYQQHLCFLESSLWITNGLFSCLSRKYVGRLKDWLRLMTNQADETDETKWQWKTEIVLLSIVLLKL